MKVLALDVNTYEINYAYYDGLVLETYGKLNLTQHTQSKMLVEITQCLGGIAIDKEIDLVVMEKVNISNENIEIRGLLRYLFEKNKYIFQEYKADGWFKAITNGRNTIKQKMKLLSEFDINIYKDELNLLNDETAVVNVILLGHGVVSGKLQLGE